MKNSILLRSLVLEACEVLLIFEGYVKVLDKLTLY